MQRREVTPIPDQSPVSHRAPEQARTQARSAGRDLRQLLNKRRNLPISTGPRVSVGERLTKIRDSAKASVASPDSGVDVSSPRSSNSQILGFEERMGQLEIDIGRDPLGELFAFCSSRGFAEPQVEIYRRKVVVCRLTVCGKTYFEYNDDNEAAARQKVAKTALTALKIAERRKAYPIIKESNHEVAVRLHELLLKFPSGVVEKSLQEIFQQSTGMSLPDNWTDVITTYTRFFSLDSGPLAHVVYANEISTEEKIEPEQPQELQLPWGDAHWNLYVTHVVSTTMLYGRIIGAEFSGRWDVLLDEIEKAMATDAKQMVNADEIAVEKMYLLQRMQQWCRVTCQEIDTAGKRFLGLFVDLGMQEWLPMESAHHCQDRFCKLPGQAILFTLFGLESMEENPHAKAILDSRLYNKTMVAEILSRADKFEESGRIRAVLFDTSGDEDVNVTELLQQDICAAGKPPALSATGLTQVTVTHISDRGDVFCQIPGSGVAYVNKVLEKLSQNEELLSRHQGLNENLSAGDNATRYLVLDRQSGDWLRAILKVRHRQTELHAMYCLDMGYQITVSEKDIYHLEPMSLALSRYPALALRCQLYDVPPMDTRLVSRIKGLLGSQCLALARVMKSLGQIPKVNLYLRIQGKEQKLMCCINDTLRLEHELESGSN